MAPVVGHAAVRESLERHLPRVALLRGPDSVGKTRLADHLAEHYGAGPADVLRAPALTADLARSIKKFAATAPLGGDLKLVVACLDGASPQAFNALLKVLEEPPGSVRFILTASEPPPDTIVSRSHVYRMGLLGDDEVAEVLRAESPDADPAEIRAAAEYGQGQVGRALRFERVETCKPTVLSLLKALAEHDADLFDAVARKWSPYDPESRRHDAGAHQLLQQWCVEAITGQWRAFSPSECFGLASTALPRRILVSLGRSGAARPELALRAALATMVRPKA